MDSAGEFYRVEKEGKLIKFDYHHPIYHPIPSSSGESSGHNNILQPLFLCPSQRCQNDYSRNDAADIFELYSSPETTPGHHVLPLFWCNNKESDGYRECKICYTSNIGTKYYFCESHSRNYHKECVESPLRIKHPYHPQHSLQLFFIKLSSRIKECICCGSDLVSLAYHCTICDVSMHPICAMKSISFVIDKSKVHDHPLTFFPRQSSLTCNVCGLLRKNSPTYVCLRCNFVAHHDCMYSPHIIRISRHHHRISYVSSLQSGKWSCGVCRRYVDSDFGAYTCEKCNDYVVHSRCALRKDVWDGEELEGVPEEDDITQDAEPFDIINEGVIHHFLHDHHLQLKVSIFYDDKKICQACFIPVYEGDFYSCMECDFIIHEACAGARRRIQHALHPHPLSLKAACRNDCGYFECNSCKRSCGAFVYECCKGKCTYNLDVRCASISEPFDYKGHEHPLFLALDPGERPICEVCKSKCYKQLNCIECTFIVCLKCATLPYKARYQHETHFLTILHGKEVCKEDWCEACERNLGVTNTKMFYWCDLCRTTLHVGCLFGPDPYMKPGIILEIAGKELQILDNKNLSSSICTFCHSFCHRIIVKIKTRERCYIFCSMRCGIWFAKAR